MKHNLKITLILLLMFLIAQFIGLYVVNHYSDSANQLPLGLQQPDDIDSTDPSILISIIMAFIIAILVFFLLSRFKVSLILKLWFTFVIFIALTISILAFLPSIKYATLIAGSLAVFLAILKVYQRNILVHNITELFIYPGIAAVFVPLLNVFTIIIFLVLISIYDIWAVWHSGIMQKMAKYHMNDLKIFPGFFVPYASKKVRQQIENWKRTLSKSKLAKKKIKVSVAILGGGDVVFPIIAAGVLLRSQGLASALFVTFGALLGLTYLFFIAKKRKYYPAMPYITAGILLGILGSYVFL